MTSRKYWRLVLVSFVPLLFFGVGLFTLVYPYPKYASTLCQPYSENSNCFTTSNDAHYAGVKESWRKMEPDQPTTTFTVDVGGQTGYLVNQTEALRRTISGGQITDTAWLTPTDEKSAALVKTLVQRPAHITLGRLADERSIVSDQYVSLSCDTLEYQPVRGEYKSYCVGENWAGNVVYRLSDLNSNSSVMLADLQRAILEERSNTQSDYNFYRLVTWPIFLYAFFLLSGIVWLAIKAVRFVRTG